MTASSVTCVKCDRTFAATVVVCPFCGQRRSDVAPATGGAQRLTPLPGARATPLPGARSTPLPGARGTPLPPGAADGTCYKCSTPIRSQTGVCGRCGWDGARARRACLRCGSLVTLNVHGISLGVQGAAVSVISIAVGFFFGVVGALALALALAAVGSALYAQGVGYRCESCGQVLPARYLSISERQELKRERWRYRLGAVVLTVVGAGAVALWFALAAVPPEPARQVTPAPPLSVPPPAQPGL